MEQLLLVNFDKTTTHTPNHPSSLSPQQLHIALSLITNPSTSLSTLSALLKTLTLILQNPNFSAIHHHRILSLLSALSHRHPHLRPDISALLSTFILSPSTSASSSLLAHSLSVLFNDTYIKDDVILDESMFLSLCFRPCKASLRHWLLQNADKFAARPSVFMTVLLGFSKDPYPYIREVALDGLVLLCKVVAVEDQSLVQGCYFRAVELLFDAEDSLRCSAVRAVSEWGRLIVACNEEKLKGYWSDVLFVQLCSVARDMSMKVRVEAFDALAKVKMVSEHILLQTLSKKASSATKDKYYPGQYTAKVFELPASSAAFSFVHGLEDEFFERDFAGEEV